MLPYFSFTEIHLGPVTLHVWGLMVALGILAGVHVLRQTAKLVNAKPEPFEEVVFWVLLSAFIGARIGHFAFYASAEKAMEFFKIWEGGWSSMGGIIGGALAGGYHIVYGKLKAVPHAADVLLSGFPIGMAVGRIGCFLIHDHPGTLSNALLAVQFPGGARHDLALYESLAMFALAAVVALAGPMLLKKQSGLLALKIASVYALVRFPLDFLRASDVMGADMRYAGLTMAQYGCLAIVLTVTGFVTKEWYLRER